jgi:hypothetical protein
MTTRRWRRIHPALEEALHLSVRRSAVERETRLSDTCGLVGSPASGDIGDPNLERDVTEMKEVGQPI